ncbi:MAG: sulfotransferase, partial [Caulobacterales bacterium]
MADAKTGASIPYSCEELLAIARKETGIDLYDSEALEPASVLLDSFNREGELHADGAKSIERRFVRLLSNRLRMRRDIAAHPEILDQTVKAPIIVCGIGRSGSTKTQGLLAASGDFNWLPYWQVFNPSLFTGDRSESPQPRIQEAEKFCAYFDRMSPDNKKGHHFQAHNAEEESMILEHSLRTPCFMGWAPLPSYLTWVMRQDLSAQIFWLRDTLKYLQWQGLADSNKRWVLKSPLYSGMEPLLLQAFPDASLTMTHRTPAATIPSGIRLMETFFAPFRDAQPDGQSYAHAMAAALDAHLASRASMPANTFYDIDFRRLVTDTANVLREIYAFADAPLTEQSLKRMIDWDASNPEAKFGKHVYSLEQFGLTNDGIERDFAPY